MPSLPRWCRHILPDPTQLSVREQLRSSLGALIGLLVTAAIAWFAIGDTAGLPLLIAPMGASAVLLFGVPASPLAQPWPLVGGNLVGALAGVGCACLIPIPLVAAAAAVAATVLLMFVLRCVHPPSGAVAITAVLGGTSIHALGYAFLLYPVGINSLALVASAVVYHRLTGHTYPHRAKARTPVPDDRATKTITRTELDALLRNRAEILDVDVGDLEWFLEELARKSEQRREKVSHLA